MVPHFLGISFPITFMIITKIEQQKRHPGRVNIFLDDAFAFGLHKEVVVRFGLRRGDELTKETIDQITSSEEQTLARQKALQLLNYRMRSEHELRAKLFDKEFPPDIIDRVVEELRTLGYINDDKFARALIHDAQLKQPTGKHRLQQKLRSKGIASAIINTVLAETFSEDDETAAALTAATKRLRHYSQSRKPVEPSELPKRIARYLAQRGFRWPSISAVLKKLFHNHDTLVKEE
jgi:regulatory protein